VSAPTRAAPLPALTVPLLAICLLVAGGALAACDGERERLSQELTDELAAAGVEAFDVSVWPPHGMVPHTNVELRVEGDEAAARVACAAVERLAVYDGDAPYLVRVAYDSGRIVECGWGTEEPRPGGPSPDAPTAEAPPPPIDGPPASPPP
jgi:hypothetical protein